MKPKKDKYPQVGPRDWMNQHGWYAERGGYKPQQGVLPQVMPGMYPGNVPIVMNQQATEPVYMDVPAYEHGGYHARPGYFYNGQSMQKAAGSGTYANGVYFQKGGKSNSPKGAQYVPRDGNVYFPTYTYPGDSLTNNQIPYAARYQYNNGTSGGIGLGEYEGVVTEHPRYFPSIKDKQKMEEYQKKMGAWEKAKSLFGYFGAEEMPAPQYQQGGYPHPLDRPFDNFEYGGETDNGYTGSVSREAALRQLECMEMGGNPHPLDIPFDQFKKGGIHIKPENKGKFNATKKATGKTTEELTHSSNPVTKKRAIFAQNAAKWNKEYGGPVNPFHPLRQFATGGLFAPGTPEEDPAVQPPPQASPPVVDPLAPDPSDPNDPRNMNPAYAQQNVASRTGVAQQTQDPATTAPWRAGMTDEQAMQNLNDRPTTTEYAQQFQQPKRNGALNWGAAILGAGTGILGAASMMHDKYQNRNTQQMWMRDQNKSANLPTAINPMSKGTYSQDGNMPYSNFSQSPNIRTMQKGGQYEKNKTYELDDATINDLIKKGYKIQRL